MAHIIRVKNILGTRRLDTGSCAHSLNPTAEQNYNITKMKDMATADHNGDGVVDLKTEYNFASCILCRSYDKGGKTDA